MWCSPPLRSTVAVIGACGAVGRTISLLLRCSPQVHDLRLVDSAPDDGAKGVAEDLSHIEVRAPVRGAARSSPADVRVTGYSAENMEAALQNVDLVISAAGQGRTKGMRTFDKLFEQNARVASGIALAVGRFAPPSAWLAVTTSPVNCTLPVMAAALRAAGRYCPQRLFGMTSINTARARCYYEKETGERAAEGLTVVGGQTGLTIVPLFSTAGGTALSEEVTELLTVRVSAGGGSIIKYAQPSSLACARACCDWVEAALPVIRGEANEVVLTALVESPLFPACPFFSSPLRLTREGVKEVLPLPRLSKYEEDLLDRCLPDMEKNIRRGFDFFEKMKEENETDTPDKV